MQLPATSVLLLATRSGCAAALHNKGLANSMIAHSLQVFQVPSLLHKIVRGLLLAFYGPMANLPRTHCFTSLDRCV